jgi:aminocarboxymuconate-semialdehyde decarboxylase
MTTDTSIASSPAGAGARRRVVDHQAHWYPRACVEALAERSSPPMAERTADGSYVMTLADGAVQPAMEGLLKDLDEHLEQATAAGIDTLVIGPAMLGEVLNLDAAEAAELLDRLHEEYAAAQRAHPERVACLAALPMQDPSVALEVLDRAVSQLNLRGVALVAANEGRPLANDESLAVYARIAELGVPLFLHPGFRSITRAHTRSFREEVGLAWMFQTALAALELVDGGVFDAVPDLVVVHPHLGGVLPYVAGRISPLPGSAAAQPLEHYLKTRFYVDTAAATPAALALAIEMYGLDRLVFATDHPFLPMRALRDYLEDNLPSETAAQVYANRVPGLTISSAAVMK